MNGQAVRISIPKWAWPALIGMTLGAAGLGTAQLGKQSITAEATQTMADTHGTALLTDQRLKRVETQIDSLGSGLLEIKIQIAVLSEEVKGARRDIGRIERVGGGTQ